jgi:hypothetical protein
MPCISTDDDIVMTRVAASGSNVAGISLGSGVWIQIRRENARKDFFVEAAKSRRMNRLSPEFA